VTSILDPFLIEAVKRFEGYSPKPYWDYKQYTSGYGTRATSPGEMINKSTAEQRLQSELQNARGYVDRVNPNAPPGVKDALTSLTFNSGSKWTQSGLGDSIRAGDWTGAREKLLQYNKAGGQTLPGLAQRRQQEASWFNRLPGGHIMEGQTQLANNAAPSPFPPASDAASGLPVMGGAPTPPAPEFPSSITAPTEPPAGMPRIPEPPKVPNPYTPPPAQTMPELAPPPQPSMPDFAQMAGMGGMPGAPSMFGGMSAPSMMPSPVNVASAAPMGAPAMGAPDMGGGLLGGMGGAAGGMGGGMMGGMGMLGGLLGGGGGAKAPPIPPAAQFPPLPALDPSVMAMLLQQPAPFNWDSYGSA